MQLLLAFLLAQETTPDATSGDLFQLIVRSYGIAAPAILGLGFIAWTFWKRLTAAQDEMARVLHAQAEKVVPALVETTHRLDENSHAMERATLMMHQLAGRPVDVDVMRRMLRQLERVEDLEARRRAT